MQFKIDENLPAEVAVLLKNAGHDASTVLEQNLGGVADPNLAITCKRELRALVTLDLGFADIRTFPPNEFPGILVLRLRRQDKITVLEVFGRILSRLYTEQLDRKLWIVDEERIRIRG
jgi:predicted nuclease of predicted toxin-antitoxin system